jgi:hypothetical protein
LEYINNPLNLDKFQNNFIQRGRVFSYNEKMHEKSFIPARFERTRRETKQKGKNGHAESA